MFLPALVIIVPKKFLGVKLINDFKEVDFSFATKNLDENYMVLTTVFSNDLSKNVFLKKEKCNRKYSSIYKQKIKEGDLILKVHLEICTLKT